MNDHIEELVSHYGSETALALAYLMSGDRDSAVEVLEDLIAFILSQGTGSSDDEDHAFPNPGAGQVQENGDFHTVQSWFLDHGWAAPTGPDGLSAIPADFIWAPNAPSPADPSWATADWCWRPPLA